LSLYLNWAPLYEGVLGKGGTTLRILDLGTGCRWVVSFAFRLLYFRGKSPWYPLDRRLCGPQGRSRHGGKDQNYQPLSGLELILSSLRYYLNVSWRSRAWSSAGSGWSLMVCVHGHGRKLVGQISNCQVYKLFLRHEVSNCLLNVYVVALSVLLLCHAWRGPCCLGVGSFFPCWLLLPRTRFSADFSLHMRKYIQKFPDWPPGARTANGTALCH
jgi:hypothetical protein